MGFNCTYIIKCTYLGLDGYLGCACVAIQIRDPTTCWNDACNWYLTWEQVLQILCMILTTYINIVLKTQLVEYEQVYICDKDHSTIAVTNSNDSFSTSMHHWVITMHVLLTWMPRRQRCSRCWWCVITSGGKNKGGVRFRKLPCKLSEIDTMKMEYI